METLTCRERRKILLKTCQVQTALHRRIANDVSDEAEIDAILDEVSDRASDGRHREPGHNSHVTSIDHALPMAELAELTLSPDGGAEFVTIGRKVTDAV